MTGFRKPRYAARFAENAADILAAQRLRYRSFRAAPGPEGETGLDADDFDRVCRHVLVEDTRDGRLVCCFRILPLRDGSEIGRSYSAQYYDLEALKSYTGPMVEMGRFCVDPAVQHPDILRVAWGAVTGFVEENGVELLFGCSSFHGTEAEEYHDAFALLAERHLAPKRWLPRVKAPRVFRFAARLGLRKPDLKLAMKRMPPLLRTYLVMGGWVSDHAVIDKDLNTLHVFTGVEVRSVPKARARLLRTRDA
ncbi:GNAT family N-acetyltransferase [Paroceanicella profunda]|uniref:L-ornithine N(alpha)-acyltransferase n=1 Tax=Paroceanicella profunda TaxID=2579971 RepID=A0A5B8FIK8_9RHOB|nr:GNAT family N-acetyltransferase [Paroceanicella profunda]QDL93367.1 GNAT family N-acetyltransferase [Paroceanicella profunda]